MRVCETYPLVKMTVKSEVDDDEDTTTITVGAVVTLKVKLERQSLKVLFDKETYDEKEEKQNSIENGNQEIDGSNEKENVEKVFKKKFLVILLNRIFFLTFFFFSLLKNQIQRNLSRYGRSKLKRNRNFNQKRRVNQNKMSK